MQSNNTTARISESIMFTPAEAVSNFERTGAKLTLFKVWNRPTWDSSWLAEMSNAEIYKTIPIDFAIYHGDISVYDG